MDKTAYLKRIKAEDSSSSDYDYLKTIHTAHLMTVPFENLSIHCKEAIELDADKLFKKIVIDNRGGFCFELNSLFYELLCSSGFNAKRISARVFNDKGIPGPDFDHMAIIVKIGDSEYLCDVGFGDSFIEPLELVINKEQEQRGYTYRITAADNNEFLLSRSTDKIKWEMQFLLTMEERELKDYNYMCHYHQSSPDSPFTRKKVCTIATQKGRITLRENKLIITENFERKEYPFAGEDKFEELLSQYFGIKL